MNDSVSELELDSDLELDAAGGLKIDYTTTKSRKSNKPDQVRQSFIIYLREAFPYKEHWEHPTNGVTYPHAVIKSALEEYREINRGYYRALWALWVSQQSREFISNHFNFSGSSVKRRWNKSIDTLILMLLFPDLKPVDAINLYHDRM
ncbi:hypothetical protein ACQ4M3_09260 [Leptolyngbya sp. AN03gr2]|uniref:hypothetical protein n=1 Tax=Leptolyngbya sp. AN03gr2 TaxID=3423364 RepID=UPI003D31CC08